MSCAWPSGRASQRERHREQLLELLSSPRQREVFISDINIAVRNVYYGMNIYQSHTLQMENVNYLFARVVVRVKLLWGSEVEEAWCGCGQ